MENMFGTEPEEVEEERTWSPKLESGYRAPRRSLTDILGIERSPVSEEPYTATQRLAEMRQPKLTDLILPIATLAMAAKSKGPAALGPVTEYVNRRRDYMRDLEDLAWKETQQNKLEDEKQRRKATYSQAAQEMMGGDLGEYAYMKPFLGASMKEDPEEAVKLLLQIMKPKAGAQGTSGWASRSAEWDAISAMPDGEEKELAKQSYLWKWTPGTGYQASPQAVEQGASKAAAAASASTKARIGAEAGLADVSAETAAKETKAKTEASVAGKYSAAAQGQYDLSGTEATSLGKAVMSIDAMKTMANKLDAGDVGFFSLTPAGKYTNPEARKLFQIINEYYARPLSGAAINATEWKQFKSEVLDKWDTLSPEARKVAAARLRQLATADIQVGALVTKDDQWLVRIRNAGVPQFDSEAAARAAGYKKGDKVRILINGKYVSGTLD